MADAKMVTIKNTLIGIMINGLSEFILSYKKAAANGKKMMGSSNNILVTTIGLL